MFRAISPGSLLDELPEKDERFCQPNSTLRQE
jgi:hypothetical protein